jgi:hypothetical protein
MSRKPVIGGRRPPPAVIARETPAVHADIPASVIRAKEDTIRLLKGDLKAMLDLIEAADADNASWDDIAGKAETLRQRWGMQ